MYEIEKYYVWKDGDRADADGFFDYDEAYDWAMEIGADEIEKTMWYKESAYEGHYPADEFKTVWERR